MADLLNQPAPEKNYCGGWGWLCDLVGYNQVRNCIDSPGIESCLSAALSVATDVFVAVKGVKVAGTLADALAAGDSAAAESGAADLAKACSHSFSADTLVLMADGTEKPISQLKVGDKVKATDPATGVTTIQTVTATMIHNDDDLLDISIVAADGTPTVLHTTAHHQIWDATRRTFIEAATLPVGDKLQQANGGLASISSVVNVAGASKMYDLTISIDHTFYAGATPVLVHNSCIWPKANAANDNCEACAAQIQKIVGGEVKTITPRGAPRLGSSTNDPTGAWFDHTVVVKDGRVYDAGTGSGGLTIDQFKAQWGDNAPYIDFGF